MYWDWITAEGKHTVHLELPYIFAIIPTHLLHYTQRYPRTFVAGALFSSMMASVGAMSRGASMAMR